MHTDQHSRHEKYHTKPVKCHGCNAGFASAKDLKRHVDRFSNWIGCHAMTKQEGAILRLRYLCPYARCFSGVGAIPLMHGFRNPYVDTHWGFGRRDHWQAHLKNKHHLSRSEIQGLVKKGIATAMYDDTEGSWKFRAADGVTITEANIELYLA